VTYDDANIWCMDHGVLVTTIEDRLTLQLGRIEVAQRLTDGGWTTWQRAFLALVRQLRAQLEGTGSGTVRVDLEALDGEEDSAETA
jgi:hypothetical protein